MTECNQEAFGFTAHFSRRVEAGFSAGQVSSEGGSLLLREADRKIKLIDRFGACFTDGRDPDRVEHTLREMLAQRLYGLALGYEDLNDHEQLRADPLLALLAGRRELDRPLAGKSTLNRLELSGRSERYHKIGYVPEAIDKLLVDLFLEAHAKPPKRTSTRPTSRSMAISRSASSMVTTTATAICRCTSSATTICCARGCVRPTGTLPPGRSRRSRASSNRCANAGRTWRSCCAPTPASAARN